MKSDAKRCKGALVVVLGDLAPLKKQLPFSYWLLVERDLHRGDSFVLKVSLVFIKLFVGLDDVLVTLYRLLFDV